MARPTSSVRKITRLAKGSLGIIIPHSLLKALGWRERQRVLVKRVARGFVIRDAITKHRKAKR